MMEKIAILLAAYNGEEFIAQQLDSLLNQTEKDFICYIHDDGSTDRTIEIIECYEKNYPQIRLLRYEPTGGSKNNFFSMLSKVRAEYYMFSDQDDVWLPDKVEKTYQKMMKLEKTAEGVIPCAVFSDLSVVDAQLNTIHSSYMQYMNRDPHKIRLEELLVKNVGAGCTMMINHALAELGRSYENADNITMHDWWLLLVASTLGTIGYVEEPLILYRQHSANVVGTSNKGKKWLMSKMKNIIQCTQLQESQKGILAQRRMAYELHRLPGLKNKDAQFLGQLASIGQEHKWKRMAFYRKHRLLSGDFKNRWKILIV